METLAVHSGRSADTAAIAPPITLSVTFARDGHDDPTHGHYYSSKGNPNRDGLETAFAALEGGVTAVAFASGCAAIGAVLRTLAPGDHVLIPDDVFQGTVRLLTGVLARWGLSYTAVDMTDVDAVRRAFQRNTRMVWTETLSNPLLKVTDLALIADLAHERSAICVVDNSFVTPIFQQPLRVGVDLVVHATTKYVGGHADVLGGIVIAGTQGPAVDEVRRIQHLEGAVPSPFDCWLVHRGISTLAYRMRGHAENALAVARALEGHPMLDAVHYPGLPSHPHHALARRQLSGGFGGILSIQLRGGKAVAQAVCDHVEVFRHATSFGAVESLIQHQASSPTHGFNTGLADNLLRLSIGLEHPDDLIADVTQALRAAT